MNFTKGPWHASCLNDGKEGCHCGYVFNPGGIAICKVYHNDKDADPENFTHNEEIITVAEKNANARLISASPDLLEALKEMVACGMVPISSASEGGAARHARQVIVADMVRAAIAKAEGTV
jgi:hypothetical protein